MTTQEAHAALELAPRDDRLSAVHPKKLRREVVAHVEALLDAMSYSRIDLTPNEVRAVASAVQDCADPVPIYFSYEDFNVIGGHINVGWNKKEVEIRNGDRARPLPLLLLPTKQQISQSIEKQKAPQPAPTPPVVPEDPKSPKFVLKRPKL